MKRYSFEDLKFKDHKESVRVFFLGNYYFDIDKSELERIGSYEVRENDLLFSGKERKMEHIINNGFDKLYNSYTGRRTIYIHRNSGIPLIGTSYFGIVDRNTSLIEIRPNTGCNLSCIYCSVNEGGKKAVDYVVEPEYLLQELEKVIGFKQEEDIEVHINPQGEPLLYKPLAGLIKGIKGIDAVKRISIDTNGVALTEKRIDEMIESGVTQFNISIDSLDENKAEEISGAKYPVNRIKEIAKYISERTGIIIAPLYLPGFNDDDIEKIIEFAKGINSKVGVQNFLPYKQGKNPVKGVTMDDFYKKLRGLEEKHGIKLVYNSSDFGIRPTKRLPIPFNKDEVVDCEVACPGRFENEVIGVTKERAIEIKDYKKGQKIKAKILRRKHNIFRATHVG